MEEESFGDGYTNDHAHSAPTYKSFSLSSQVTFSKGLLKPAIGLEGKRILCICISQAHHLKSPSTGSNLVRWITELQTRKWRATPDYLMKPSLRPREAKWLALGPTASPWLKKQSKSNLLIFVQLLKGCTTWQNLKIVQCPSGCTGCTMEKII